MNLKPAKDLRQQAQELERQAAAQEARDRAAQDERDKAAFAAKQAEHEAERAAVLDDYRQTEATIVQAVQELDGLLQALSERRKQCALLGVNPPQSYTARLEMGVKGALQSWKTFRPELVGNPPKPDPHLAELREARAEVVRCEKMLADWQGRLTAAAGTAHTGVGAESLRRAGDWSQALQLARARLSKALADGPQSREIRAERLALMDATAEPVMLTVPV